MTRARRWRIAGVVLGIVLFIAAVGWWAVPWRRVPPTGPYATESVLRALEDPSREEPFTDDPDDHRVLPVEIWIPQRDALQDARFVLGQLEQLVGDVPLAGHVDSSRVAVVGHSFGGAVAIAVCREDPRCAAVVDLDGMLIGDVRSADPPRLDPTPLEVPALFVTSGELRSDPFLGPRWTWTMDEAARHSNAPALVLDVRGAGHLDLTDLTTLVRPAVLRRLVPTAGGGPTTQVGTADPGAVARMTHDVVRGWLDRYLRGHADATVLDPDRYPFVRAMAQAPPR